MKSWVSAREALESVDADLNKWNTEITSEYANLVPLIPPGINYSYFTEKLGHPNPRFEWRSKFSSFLRKADPEKPVRTITSQPGAATGPFHWDNRRFTPVELAVLQGFDESVSIPDSQTKARSLIGNAVPPTLAESLAPVVSGQERGVSSDGLPSAYRGRVSFEERKGKAEKYIEYQHGDDT
jgi:DNA (cytosine-5)-methyltransferase 1